MKWGMVKLECGNLSQLPTPVRRLTNRNFFTLQWKMREEKWSVQVPALQTSQLQRPHTERSVHSACHGTTCKLRGWSKGQRSAIFCEIIVLFLKNSQ